MEIEGWSAVSWPVIQLLWDSFSFRAPLGHPKLFSLFTLQSFDHSRFFFPCSQWIMQDTHKIFILQTRVKEFTKLESVRYSAGKKGCFPKSWPEFSPHMVERQNWFPQPVLWLPHLCHYTHTHIKHHRLVDGDFNTFLSPTYRSSRQKLKGEIMKLTDTMSQINLRNICRIFHPKSRAYIFSYHLLELSLKLNI